jgi:hypothetical protein
VNPSQLDGHAAHHARLQQQFQQALLGALARTIDMPHGADPRARYELIGELARAQDHVLGEHWHYANVTAFDAAAAGVQAAKRKLTVANEAVLAETVIAMHNDALAELRTVVLRDTSAVLRAWTRYALNVQLLGRNPDAIARARAKQGVVGSVRFSITDRAGKRWDSTLLVHTQLRWLYLLLRNEALLFTLVKSGRDTAKASWGDDRPAITFSITGKNAKLPSYMTVREGIFHPNSTAMVTLA